MKKKKQKELLCFCAMSLEISGGILQGIAMVGRACATQCWWWGNGEGAISAICLSLTPNVTNQYHPQVRVAEAPGAVGEQSHQG